MQTSRTSASSIPLSCIDYLRSTYVPRIVRQLYNPMVIGTGRRREKHKRPCSGRNAACPAAAETWIDRADIIGPGNINGSSARAGKHAECVIPGCLQFQFCLTAATIGLEPDGYGAIGSLVHEAAQMVHIESLFQISTGRLAL